MPLRPALAVCFTLAAAASAAADPGRLVLDWSAPAACPDRAAVEAETRALLTSGAPESFRARGVVARRGAGYVLELTTEHDGARGVRRLSAGDCSELTKPAALVLALAIDPTAAERLAKSDAATLDSAEPAPVPSSPSAGAAVAALPPVTAPSAAPLAPAPAPRTPPVKSASRGEPPEPTRRAAIGSDARVDRIPERAHGASSHYARSSAGATLDVGTLPAPALGAVLALAGGFQRLELEAKGALFGGQTESIAGEAAGSFSLIQGGLSGCVRVLDLARVAPCVGVAAGRLRGEGRGVTDPDAGSAWLWAAGAGVRASEAVAGPARLWARADVAVALNRPRFVLENVGSVHRPAALAAQISLGAEVLFP